MKKVKLIVAGTFMLFIACQLSSQSIVLIITNENNNREYTIKPYDKVMLDLKNRRGKLKEKQVAVVLPVRIVEKKVTSSLNIG
jgi:hypothetical protein